MIIQNINYLFKKQGTFLGYLSIATREVVSEGKESRGGRKCGRRI